MNKQNDIGNNCTLTCEWTDAPQVLGFHLQNNGEGTMTYRCGIIEDKTKNMKVPKEIKLNDENAFSLVVGPKSDGMAYLKKINFREGTSLSWDISKKYKYHLQHKIQKEIESHCRHAEYFEFEIGESGNAKISVLQKDARHFKPSDEYKYSSVQMVLLKKESENQYKFISNSFII